MDRLIVTKLNDRICTAAVSGSRITQLMMEPEDSSSLLNDIYIGKVQKVVGNINAAFVDIGGGRTGYYSLDENKEHLIVSYLIGKAHTRPANGKHTVPAGKCKLSGQDGCGLFQ